MSGWGCISDWLQKRHEEIQQLLVQQHNCGHLPPTLYHPFEKRLRSSYEELLKDGKLQFRTDSGGPEDLYSQLKAKFEEAHTSALGQNSKVVWVNGAFCECCSIQTSAREVENPFCAASQYQSLYNYPKIDLAYNRSELLRELESGARISIVSGWLFLC